MNKYIKSIRKAANIGFYGGLILVILTVAEHYTANYLWQRVITVNDFTRMLMMMTGLFMSVINIAVILLYLRKNTPRLRQLDAVEDKLKGYASTVKSVYYTTFAVILVLCAFVVLSRENTLIMLLLLLVLLLLLNYPNMYKMKVDLGLNDEQMKELFGDDYISDNSNTK